MTESETKFDFLARGKTSGWVMVPKKHLQDCFHCSGDQVVKEEMFRIGFEHEYSQFFLLKIEQHKDQHNHPGVFVVVGESTNYKPEDNDTCIGCREKFTAREQKELSLLAMPELDGVVGIYVHRGAPLCVSVAHECLIVMKMLIDGRPPPGCEESNEE